MIRRSLAGLLLLSSLVLTACGAIAPTATPVPVAAPTSAPLVNATDTTAPPAPTAPPAAPPATATTAPLPPTATNPPPAASLTDAGILAALQAAGLPIAETVIYTAETDPNKFLGRPNQYIAKAAWHDSRLPAPTNPKTPEVSDGGGLEIYPDAAGAATRGAYIAGIGKASPLFAEYDYLYGPVLLRLALALTPTQAADYTKAMDTLTGTPGATPVVK